MKHLLFLGAVELGSRLFLPAALGSLMSTSIAVAQTSDQVPRGAIAAELYFPEDRDNRDIRVATLSAESERHLGAGVWLRGALGLVFTEGVKVEDDGPQSAELEADAVGLGTAGFVRWRPFAIGPVAPFAEFGVGVLYMSEPFPPGGTRRNSNWRRGFGLDIRLSDELTLTVAFRHIHISNGKGLVPENPSYDGDGFMIAFAR